MLVLRWKLQVIVWVTGALYFLSTESHTITEMIWRRCLERCCSLPGVTLYGLQLVVSMKGHWNPRVTPDF